MAPTNDNNDEEDFLNRQRKWLTQSLQSVLNDVSVSTTNAHL